MKQFKPEPFIFAKGWTKATGLEAPKRTAEFVRKLSDIYTDGKGSPQIWKSEGFQKAYLAYFFPLNSVRVLRALEMTNPQILLNGIDQILEFGSGPGTAHLSFCAKHKPLPWLAIEKSVEAQKIHLDLAHKLNFPAPDFIDKPLIRPNTLAVLSYVLTETDLPDWVLDCDALFIIEPSMRDPSRDLMALREKITAAGFTITAPCTHQEECPLLLHTKRDWCHFRVHFDKPDFFAALEEYLPMKNDSLTFSFLAATKNSRSLPTRAGRVIGEAILEKGKVRQGICRSSEREQLSWLRRSENIVLPESGSLFELPADIKKLGPEIRMN